MTTKKFILVGAGPGDPDLISFKGIKALQKADVVLYDALVSEELLNYAPNALKIYCGKRAGAHYMKQEEINRKIVECIHQYDTVVRLKGGDPFIFGRGQEEIDIVRQEFKEIDIEVIPGISSAIGIPTLHQIPLTQRGKNESIWIVTGTTSSCSLSQDIQHAAASTANVVILMGMNQLENIIDLFASYRGKEHPITIIENGSYVNEKKISGTLNTILPLVKEHNIQSPAVIIIGTR